MSNYDKIAILIPDGGLSWLEDRTIKAIATVLDQKDAEIQTALDELSKNILEGTTAALTEIIKERDERNQAQQWAIAEQLKERDERIAELVARVNKAEKLLKTLDDHIADSEPEPWGG